MATGVTVAVTFLLVASQSRVALVLFAWDGAIAAAVLLAATLGGMGLVRVLGFEAYPLRWRVLIGAALGLGALSAAVLFGGVLGYLKPAWWWGALILGTLAGTWSISCRRGFHCDEARNDNDAGWAWLWVLAAPFAALIILVCVVPAGFLWAEEGLAYDVLEYHLQLPKEYFQQGFIAYTPHNVYGNFPANVEMLYLLCLVLRGDVYDGAATGQILNAGLAGLFVFAAYVAGREHSRAAGCVTGVLAAGTGWVTYLSGIAYVENGLLFFAMTATAAVMRTQTGGGIKRPAARGETEPRALARGRGQDERSLRPPPVASAPGSEEGDRKDRASLAGLAGLCAGLACGCKYSAVLLVAMPLTLAFGFRRPRGGLGVRYGLCTAVAFAPWLIKNAVMTGDPVFPLGEMLFHARPPGWGDDEARHFLESHTPEPRERSLTGSLAMVWRRLPADPDHRFGPVLFLLAGVGWTVLRRSPTARWLGLLALLQLVFWTFATHLYARFAVPMLIPLLIVAGRAVAGCNHRSWRRGLVLILLVGLGFNLYATTSLYSRHVFAQGRKLPLEGAWEYFLKGLGGGHEHLAVINEMPESAHVLMVGDAKAFYFRRRVDYRVVFNRNPFVEAVRTAPDASAVMDWIIAEGYTHVLVNWSEIARLRRSRYDFPHEIQPAFFEALTADGLLQQRVFSTGDPPVAYAVLYAVSER